MTMTRRADALQSGDIIQVGEPPHESAIQYRVTDTRADGDSITILTELRGYGPDSAGFIQTDYRTGFTLIHSA